MIKYFSTLLLSVAITATAIAQTHLKKPVTVNIKNQPLKDALNIIGNEGDFNFSYNTNVVNKDSMVTIFASQKPVGELLRLLFDAQFEFKESGNYIIIRKKPIVGNNIVDLIPAPTPYFTVTGIVIDDETGAKIENASIYETQNLIATISDEKGAFDLKLKNKYAVANIAISKEGYRDTTIEIKAKYNQKALVALSRLPIVITKQADTLERDLALEAPVIFVDSEIANPVVFQPIQENWVLRTLLTTQAKINTINLKKFITTRKFQISLLPLISTHGKMNSQVVNIVSINALGGYSAGTDAFELGGLFNINRNHARYFQAAGLYNHVGGFMQGFQSAGLYNNVRLYAKGFQTAGLFNTVSGDMNGVQISGLRNSVKKKLYGLQISLINKAQCIKGLQIGLVNIVDENKGYSLGLINVSKNKRHGRRVGFLLRVPRRR